MILNNKVLLLTSNLFHSLHYFNKNGFYPYPQKGTFETLGYHPFPIIGFLRYLPIMFIFHIFILLLTLNDYYYEITVSGIGL